MSPAEALKRYWSVSGLSISPSTWGVSRKTWKVADRYWLSQGRPRYFHSYSRELELTRKVRIALEANHVGIRVPTAIPAANGDFLVEAEGSVWRLTENIGGTQISSGELRIYRPLIKGLVKIRKAMNTLSLDSASVASGTLNEIGKAEEFLNSNPWSNVTKSVDEERFVRSSMVWLKEHSHMLTKQPLVVTHGDFNPTNVIFSSEKPLRLVGLLDFESARPDPELMDFAQVFSTILCFSGLPDPSSLMDMTIRHLRKEGIAFTLDDIKVAMVAYWVRNYWFWRNKYLQGDAQVDVVERQPTRLGQVLEFVER